MELNEILLTKQITKSNDIDQIWKQYDKTFFAKLQNYIHHLDKAWFEVWTKETG